MSELIHCLCTLSLWCEWVNVSTILNLLSASLKPWSFETVKLILDSHIASWCRRRSTGPSDLLMRPEVRIVAWEWFSRCTFQEMNCSAKWTGSIITRQALLQYSVILSNVAHRPHHCIFFQSHSLAQFKVRVKLTTHSVVFPTITPANCTLHHFWRPRSLDRDQQVWYYFVHASPLKS